MIGKLRQYFQERKLERNFSFNLEFIKGVDASENSAEIYDALNQYTKRLQRKGIPKEDVQKMLDTISEYVIKRFGKQEWGGEYSFSWSMPLFYGLAEKPEYHDTLQDLERVIRQFDFVAELHGII